MGTSRTLIATALSAVLALAGGCSDDSEPAVDDTRPQLSAARPEAATPAPAAPAEPPPPLVVIDPCTSVPQSVAERIIGTPLATTEVRPTVSSEHALGTCDYATGSGRTRKALRLGVITERSFQSNAMSLDGWWQSRTLGDGEARKVEALDGRAWWVPLPPPRRQELLLQGKDAIYVLGSVYYGPNALASEELEELAAAVLAAE